MTITRVKKIVEIIHCDCCKHTSEDLDDDIHPCESKYAECGNFEKCLICNGDVCPCCLEDMPEQGTSAEDLFVFICKKCVKAGYCFFQTDRDEAPTSVYKGNNYNRKYTKKLREIDA